MSMTSKPNVHKSIQAEHLGSLVHAITEKIAYYLYVRDPVRDHLDNWFEAERHLTWWLIRQSYYHTSSSILQTWLLRAENYYHSCGEKENDVSYRLAEDIVRFNESYDA